jgi:hypothetical protein
VTASQAAWCYRCAGARLLARGGAFVAGADDADALWLDPAGLAHLRGNNKRALLFDAAFVYRPWTTPGSTPPATRFRR